MPSHSNKPNGKGNLATVFRDDLLALKLEDRAKRACDIVAAITGLILFSPILLIAALAIKRESRGSIFVGEVQFGRENRAVRIIKFRLVTTRVGRILGQTGIVELPQFINVLRGEMSFFGRRDICRWPAHALWWERWND